MRRACARGPLLWLAIALLLLAGLSWESEWILRRPSLGFLSSQVVLSPVEPDGKTGPVSPPQFEEAGLGRLAETPAVTVASTTSANVVGTSTATVRPQGPQGPQGPPRPGLSLFCFAWTPRRKYDEQLLLEVRLQFAKCDGHIFYTDTGSPGGEEPDFVRVELPAQQVSRDKGGWLYHRNMVGLMPALSHLLRSGLVDKYDWFINAELDHFLSPARAKVNIAAYAEHVEKADSPIMLMWGNAFVFNQKLLSAMSQLWDSLGVIASANGTKEEAIAVGCPLFMKGKSEWPNSCSQDIIYPALAWDVLPKKSKQKVVTLGDPGCGHPAKFRNKELPLGCWEMQQNPVGGESLQGELNAIKVLADMAALDKEAAKSYCAGHANQAVVKNCNKFYDGRQVAVIHHVNNIAVHKLARELLDSPAPALDESETTLSTTLSTSTSSPSSPTSLTSTSTPASTLLDSTPPPAGGQASGVSSQMSLLCFAWSPRRKNDEGMLNEVRKQYKKCDGHLFFTDKESPVNQDEDFVRVEVPQQRLPRTHGQWLYHRNMVGLMPAWEHLLKSGVAEKYDWLLNSELDHFLSPSRAKETIAAYLRNMEAGSKEDKAAADGPILLMWGNAFVFNRKLVQAMKENWHRLGKVAGADNETSKEGRAVGCPLFMKGRSEWPDSCSQDIIYPALAMNILPPLQVKVAFPGASGCGQPAKNHKNKEYPLGCWEMQQNPINGESEHGETAAIKELAQMTRFKEKADALTYCKAHRLEAVQKNCMKFWDGRNVPLIHHLHTVSEHVLARTLLDNDPDPQ
ncbi:unnamed protein product [Effrenium voratum]|uniref:Uncharacterized protein n=1 Tax=Effrenium voratum TaxID=2562239 RepID=A0AA36HWB1_9DINO|nr:unnamed protein product [Effrenium voratum]CAJ1416476.1 unnamed protein product [Effrenium voratum]